MKKLRIGSMILVGAIIFLTVAAYAYMQQPMFGKAPTGERLERIKKSPNFKEGSFQNLSPTPDLTEGVSYYAVIKEFLFYRSKRGKPADTLPFKKVNLHSLNPDTNILVWFGHSSLFLQLDGKKFLVDPVFSGAASPLSFTTRSYPGSDVYTSEDIPPIDYLFISHDHWDHLDYETILKLESKVKKVVCGLGVGEHFEYWGYPKDKILEMDWNEAIELNTGFSVALAPARHFSGRTFIRNKSLWVSFVLKTPSMKIFIGGDSGYDSHFADIGRAHGPFDLAILECGQYDKSWKYLHMMPEEVVQASLDLRATRLMPVHWSKFSLGIHAWDEPIIRVTNRAREVDMPMLTPIIGEAVNLKDTLSFPAWWETVK